MSGFLTINKKEAYLFLIILKRYNNPIQKDIIRYIILKHFTYWVLDEIDKLIFTKLTPKERNVYLHVAMSPAEQVLIQSNNAEKLSRMCNNIFSATIICKKKSLLITRNTLKSELKKKDVDFVFVFGLQNHEFECKVIGYLFKLPKTTCVIWFRIGLTGQWSSFFRFLEID